MKGDDEVGWARGSCSHGFGDSGVRRRPRRTPSAAMFGNDAAGRVRSSAPRPATQASTTDQLMWTWKVTVAVPPLAASVPTVTVICPGFVTL